jgi:hypothetical protein
VMSSEVWLPWRAAAAAGPSWIQSRQLGRDDHRPHQPDGLLSPVAATRAYRVRSTLVPARVDGGLVCLLLCRLVGSAIVTA